MKILWCRDIEDVVNIARSQGWLFYLNLKGNHYYYVYTGTEAELLCIAVEAKEFLKAKYVSIDEEGKLVTSEKPIMPACAKITTVVKDEGFEKLLG
ncbi:MAG: hypothetical protein AVW05_00310 [Hadesarchaea archaeon DG-33]|nr:MAG: hypothetical protein AVW05_00310 [Hadesarchaea archaeon DG-33]